MVLINLAYLWAFSRTEKQQNSREGNEEIDGGATETIRNPYQSQESSSHRSTHQGPIPGTHQIKKQEPPSLCVCVEILS